MLDINIEELRKRTKDAIEKGNKTRLKQQAEIALRLQKQMEADKKWAEKVLKGIPYDCELAAGKGEHKAFVLTIEDYSIKNASYESMPYKVKLVWDACLKAGLKPSWENNWDGGGMSSWYEFWVSW